MIALIDYDAGNIKSVEKAFQSLGKEVVLTRDPEVLKRADHVVLPGVGSFGDAMENLNRYHLVPVIHEIVEKGTPFLGICLGLQILFERSEESPGVEAWLVKRRNPSVPDKEGLKIRTWAGIPSICRTRDAYSKASRRSLTSTLSTPTI